MPAAKPVTLTQGASNPTGQAPQPFLVVGGIPVPIADVVTALKTLPGYSAGALQTLKHDTSGNLNWVAG